MPANHRPSEKYATWAKFIEDTVVESGCTMGTGRANIQAFFDKFTPVVKNAGLKPLSYNSFKKYVLNDNPSPQMDSLEALCLMLSAAKGVRITPEKMGTLINREALNALTEEIKNSELPDHEAGAEMVAAGLLTRFRKLPIDARRAVSPALLAQLAADWEYLDAEGPKHVGILLRREIDLRGMGLPTYAAKVLGGKIPLATLEAIIGGNPNPKTIKMDHLLALAEHLRSIDGGKIDIADLHCLNPKLKLPKVSDDGARAAH